MNILSDKMLRIKGSAAHSRCKCVDRPSRSADEELPGTQQRAAQKMPSKKDDLRTTPIQHQSHLTPTLC